MTTDYHEEKRRRIQVLLWAYAYECKNTSVVSDAKFDEVCKKIDVTIATDRPDLDIWFREEFSPHTGQWIHSFPELSNIERLYRRLYDCGDNGTIP